MERVVILLIISFLSHLSNVDGSKQFVLNFQQSTNKVIVTDLYYGLEYSIWRDGKKIQSVSVGTGPGGFIRSRPTSRGFILSGRGDEIEFAREFDSQYYSQFSVERRNIRKATTDCVDLGMQHDVNWYGGNQQRYQYFPIQVMKHKHNSYLPKEQINTAVAERYWLNSDGIFFRVNNDAPLFIDQNNEHPGHLCFEAKRASPYDINQPTFDFTYHVGIAVNAREAHMKAISNFLGRPTGHPNEKMVAEPIWSTWAKYKRDVNDKVVREFAQEILDNGFNGQFELDDDWEECYGSLKFNTNKFPDIKSLTNWLHSKNFRVTLWIHPFINKNCKGYYEDAKAKGRFVMNKHNNSDTTWWNSLTNQAAYIDFTKPAVAKWFSDRLKDLQNSSGIDSFKFDAGETSWTVKNPVLNATAKEYPMKITTDYVKTVSQFGDLVEFRTGYGTQNLPTFMRMIDKDTEWSFDNGLPTLITTLLQLNMNGYPLVLPDMIGGNGYDPCFVAPGAPVPENCVPGSDTGRPDEEIFLRWLQANTFMPALQFSYVPWEYTASAVEISKKFVKLHADYTSYIMERFKLAVRSGEPVNPPIWWIAPNDKTAQRIDDEFLLGDKILSAPIVVKGATQRDIYLPNGTWTDGNDGTVYTSNGGLWLKKYQVPLNKLAYFIKK